MNDMKKDINSKIKNYTDILKQCEERINNSGNVQIVAKNIRILLHTLKDLSGYSIQELEAAGLKFTNGSPAELYNKLEACKHQIISQVPSRKNYRNSYKCKYIPEYDSLFDAFYSTCDKLSAPAPAKIKLSYCLEQLALLSDTVIAFLEEDGSLPPVIACRDTAPEMCMRLGEWEKAKNIVKFCISCNAFYPDAKIGENELIYIETFQETATVALTFIQNNPGFLQKKLYKALEGQTDHDCLKHFLRCSEQIIKVKDGSTNKLYINQ